MQETRRLRLQALIQEELAVVVSREVKDPRIPPLTFTAVELTPDAGQATIFVAILGGLHPETDNPEEFERLEKENKLKMKNCLEGLASASGFLRRHLAKVLQVRHVPALAFREDKGFENATRVHSLLKKITASS